MKLIYTCFLKFFFIGLNIKNFKRFSRYYKIFWKHFNVSKSQLEVFYIIYKNYGNWFWSKIDQKSKCPPNFFNIEKNLLAFLNVKGCSIHSFTMRFCSTHYYDYLWHLILLRKRKKIKTHMKRNFFPSFKSRNTKMKFLPCSSQQKISLPPPCRIILRSCFIGKPC